MTRPPSGSWVAPSGRLDDTKSRSHCGNAECSKGLCAAGRFLCRLNARSGPRTTGAKVIARSWQPRCKELTRGEQEKHGTEHYKTTSNLFYVNEDGRRRAMRTEAQKRIERLRQEIARIQELNDRFLLSRNHSSSSLEVNEQRGQRLLEIMRELAALARKKVARRSKQSISHKP
jgi:hypothetical protein